MLYYQCNDDYFVVLQSSTRKSLGLMFLFNCNKQISLAQHTCINWHLLKVEENLTIHFNLIFRLNLLRKFALSIFYLENKLNNNLTFCNPLFEYSQGTLGLV